MKTQTPEVDAAPPPNPSETAVVRTTWEFGRLIDEEAKMELLQFCTTFERSKQSQTIFVGYTPENE